MLNVDSLANNKENDFGGNNNNNKQKEEDNFMDTLLASSKPITTMNTNIKESGDFINDLLGSNSYSSFNTKSTRNNTNTNSSNNSSGFDFNFGNNSSNNKKMIFLLEYQLI